MSNFNPAHSPSPDIGDADLQQELRQLFETDTRQYLQTYLQTVQSLEGSAWSEAIQSLYRAVHTIKGGAVTVGAEAILQVSTVLEDVLSDLRFLQPAPALTDGHLTQILLEAGELLASSVELEGTDQASLLVQPAVERLQSLHVEVQHTYLPNWNDQQRLHQEFAEHGFDLVVLDLEMALEQLPAQTVVDSATRQVAAETLTQLQKIGQDLELADGWAELLSDSQSLLDEPQSTVWRSHWPAYFQALKTSAQQGGLFVSPDFTPLPLELEEVTETTASTLLASDLGTDLTDFSDLTAVSAFLDDLSVELPTRAEFLPLQPELTPLRDLPGIPSQADDLDLAAIGALLDDLPVGNEDLAAVSLPESDVPSLWGEVGTKETAAQAGVTEIELAPSSGLQDGGDSTADLTAVGTFLDDLDFSDGLAGAEAQPEVTPMASGDPSPVEVVNISVIPPVPSATKPQASPRPKVANTEPTAQIPVALSRLDHASQSVVETLLATRAAQNDYQTLQSQLLQLVVLTQEGIQHMTQLRQIQDDYAVLDSLNSRWSDGPTPERYRQGYTSINRLLENSLRLSELGAEAEKVAAQITQNLKGLDRSVLRLQNTLEGARLVPFRNLSLRVRATLRDLITRFGKPAQLEIEGEQVELDAGTASKLEPALLHLIRNAYDHGLESVDERLSQGKPKQGAIALSLQRRGSNFWLELRDDGRGIDAHHVQQLAEAKGLAHTRTATPTDLLEVLCQPGFSSKATVSDISGRGVGMDVVAAQINQLGGRMSLETTPQQGTTFRIQFPVPQLLVSCVVVQAGSQVFAVPADDIATAAVLSTLAPFQPPSASDSCSWRLADGIPGLDLAEYWQPNLRGRSLSEMGVGLQIRLDNQVFWLLADELVNQTQLLINRIPQPLLAPRGLLGVSLQTNGQLIPVLDGVAIADTLLHAPETTLASDLVLVGDPNLPFVQPESTVPLALIVDDAALMRRRIEASLTAAGYRTHTCADGQEAWNWLQAHPQPEVLITDIEMPVMDGFTLIDRCRQAGMTLPVLVISSRLAEEWSREARRLGATDFLTKGFSTPELLNRVKTCLNAPPSDPQGSTVPAPDNTNDSLEQRL